MKGTSLLFLLLFIIIIIIDSVGFEPTALCLLDRQSPLELCSHPRNFLNSNFLLVLNLQKNYSTESGHIPNTSFPYHYHLMLVWTFVKINESVLTHCYQLQSILYSEFLRSYLLPSLHLRVQSSLPQYIYYLHLFNLFLAMRVSFP